VLVGFGRTVEWKDLAHGRHAGEQAEMSASWESTELPEGQPTIERLRRTKRKGNAALP
jgi:hypothetical protein